MLLQANFITLYFIWLVGDDFYKIYLKIEKNSCYYSSIDLKRQSEHSKFHPDTSILVVFYIACEGDFRKKQKKLN